MAYLLRTLVLLMLVGVGLTLANAFHWIDLGYSHIQLAIPVFLSVIFIQAFVMFYFIGVGRLVENVWRVLHSEKNLHELFDEPPKDLSPYLKKVTQQVHQGKTCKRQTIPWTMLMLILGMAAFLLGGAHDTGLVTKKIHVGLVYGFLAAMVIGAVRQWYYLGKSHRLLRELKGMFGIEDSSM